MTLRQWWSRFGIAAPRMAVRPQLPWLLRWIGVAVLLVLGVGLADQVYDAGARFAGFERDSGSSRWKQI